MSRLRMRSAAAALVLLASFSAAAQAGITTHSHDGRAFVIREVDGKTTCRDASGAEALQITQTPRVPLKVFGEDRGPVRANAELFAGLNIILRGTAQLDANPQARQAFERAAQIWEARIANPITVYVDVDFGTTRFGEAFPEGVIASADTDDLGGENLYDGVRSLLIARADTAAEQSIYNALPTGSIPTDIGSTTNALAPSILLRAIGAIEATAANDDSAPSIGFNSAFAYDFDPSNGITPGRKDFEGVVVHEIGHMLGFVSSVGNVELGAPANYPAIFDYFRFRPTVTSGTFTSAQRIQSSGGAQVFFAGGAQLPFSTGRGDGEGGDQNQASHWKDDDLTGVRIGIMDPTLDSGFRTELSANDLLAFAIMGYDIEGASSACSETEPNQTIETASTLTSGVPCTGSASIADQSTYTFTYPNGTADLIEDVFKITLAAPAKINATLTFTSGGADLDLFLLTIDGATLKILDNSSGGTQTEQVESAASLPAGTYYIAVSAFVGVSPYTLLVQTSGGIPVPAAPSNLDATAISSTQVMLGWTDNAGNETGYVVEARIGQSGYGDVTTVPASSTSAMISGLVPGTTYTFRVRAINATGSSGYSNEAAATTFGGTSTCVPSATVVCLLNNRFRVTINYVNQFANPPAPGTFLGAKLVAGVQNPDVATFGISSAQAIEVVVRIQDARPFGIPRFDIYYGGLTDLEYTVSVTDTQTGKTKAYRNPPGTVGGAVDRTTFPAN